MKKVMMVVMIVMRKRKIAMMMSTSRARESRATRMAITTMRVIVDIVIMDGGVDFARSEERPTPNF